MIEKIPYKLDLRRKLTKSQIKQIQHCRGKGMTLRACAAKFGVSFGTIRWHTDASRREVIRKYLREYRKRMTGTKSYDKQQKANRARWKARRVAMGLRTW